MILFFCRMLLFILSLYGYKYFLQYHFRIHSRLSWLSACCLTTLMIYIFSFTNVLNYAVYCVFIIGVFLAVYALYKSHKSKKKVKKTVNFVTLGLFVYAIIFIPTLYQTSLEHYDNFSHWGIIVKFLFTESRLPGIDDTIISFSSYPLGSSLFIYYMTKIVGFSDATMLLAQFIFILSCLSAIFSIVIDESRSLIIGFIFSIFSIFNYFNIAIRMNNLLVDFLLPLLALAIISGTYSLRDNNKGLTIYFILTTSILCIIKNSALFFFIIVISYYFYTIIHHRHQFKKIYMMLLNVISVFILSLLPYFVWRRHVKINFPVTKHDISLSAYKAIFLEKDSNIMSEITIRYLDAIRDIHSLTLQGIILFNLLMIISFFIIKFVVKRHNSILRYLFIGDSVMLIYFIGIYLMFLFSMPTEEALVLAGFERYASSIIIFALGLAAMVLSIEIDRSFYEKDISQRSYKSFKNIHTKKVYQYSTIALFYLTIIMLLSENNGMRYNIKMFRNSIPYQVNVISEPIMTINDTKYIIITTNKEAVDNYLINYVGMMHFYSPNVTGVENFVMDDQEFFKTLKEYDKFVVLEPHFTFDQMTSKNINRTFKPGIYNIRDYF